MARNVKDDKNFVTIYPYISFIVYVNVFLTTYLFATITVLVPSEPTATESGPFNIPD